MVHSSSGRGVAPATPAPVGPAPNGGAAAGLARLAALLPAASDWNPADGWLPAGLLLAATGGVALVLLAWRHINPAGTPDASRLLPAVALLSLAALAMGGAMAQRPAGQAPVWRWVTIAAAAAGALLCDPAGLHVRFGFPWFLTVGLLGLALRAGETLAAALAVPLQARARLDPLSAPTGAQLSAQLLSTGAKDPELEMDPTRGQSPLWTAWRIVAEFWVLGALSAAAAALPAGPAWRLATAATALGGAVLVVGSALATLQNSWAARRFRFNPAHAAAFWGLGLAFAAALTALALLLPMPPAPFSGRVLSGALRELGRAHLPFTAAHTSSASAPAGHGPSLIGLLILPAVVVASLVHDMWVFFGLWLLSPLALPVILPVAAAAGFFLLRALRRPQFRAFLGRLVLAALSALAFWRRLRLPRRMRRLLAQLGFLRPEPDAGNGPDADIDPSLLERLWGFVDPRAAVRLTYRRFLRTMADAGADRAAGQSPRAFEAAVRARDLAGPGIADLTGAYELARYSGRPGERGWVERARRGWAAVAARLSAGRRGRRAGDRRPRRGA